MRTTLWLVVPALLWVTVACGEVTTGAGNGSSASDADGHEPWDQDAQMRPDLMRVAPVEVAPGEPVSVFFPEETLRGEGFVLERQLQGGWVLRYYLTSAREEANTGDWQWRPAGEAYGWDDIGIEGPGPDWLTIPDTTEPGDYRICTVDTTDPHPFCTGLRVLGQGRDGEAGDRPGTA